MKIILILNTVEFELGFSKIVLSIYQFAYGSSVINAGTVLCSYNSLEYQGLMRVELGIVAVVSLMRYLIVCHQKEKSFIFWLALLLLACAPASFIYLYPAILGDAAPSQTMISCFPYMNTKYLSKVMNLIIPFLFLIPSWIITFCYFAIGLKVNKKLNQMKLDAQNNNDTQALTAIKSQKIKIIIQLTTVIVIYNLNFSLAYITWILKFAIGYNRPPIVETISGILTFITFAVNPLLTITFQPELNQEFVSILFFLNLKVKRFIKSLFR